MVTAMVETAITSGMDVVGLKLTGFRAQIIQIRFQSLVLSFRSIWCYSPFTFQEFSGCPRLPETNSSRESQTTELFVTKPALWTTSGVLGETGGVLHRCPAKVKFGMVSVPSLPQKASQKAWKDYENMLTLLFFLHIFSIFSILNNQH